jgi:16S rRNA (cytosine967-C5)-methyltransferase
VLPRRPASGTDRAGWLAYLSVTLSHPEWLVARWLDRHGPEAAASWCQFNNAAPSVTVRVAGSRDTDQVLAALAAAGIPASRGRHVTDAIDLPAGSAGRISVDLWHDLVIQDEASQLVGAVAAAESGSLVLDVCASPGGKTAILARSGARHIVAGDLRPARVALLAATIERGGIAASVVRLDARVPLPFGPVFDTVLLDAPCSGLGTLRRDPDLKWSRSEGDLRLLAAAEFEMLTHAAAVVRPGGALVYATCSSEPDENAAVVDRFIAGRRDFEPVPARFTANVAGGPRLLDDRGRLQTLPFRDGLDAFFAAVLRRRRTHEAT